MQAGVDRIEAETGPIDILVNNAGIQRRAPLEDFAVDTWREIVSANLDSVFFVGQAVARHMIARKRGKIINIASMLSFQGGIRVPSYTASTSGIAGITRATTPESIWNSSPPRMNAPPTMPPTARSEASAIACFDASSVPSRLKTCPPSRSIQRDASAR